MSKRTIPQSGEVTIPADLKAMAADVQQLSIPIAPPIPKGWYPVEQWAKAFGYQSESHTYKRLRDLTAQGITKKKRFSVLRDNRLVQVAYFTKV
jgi:hypothetical protein